ncbi:MAG: FAD/NAD(P)-binding oxidoreductase [Thermodesulfobacteriota bacterium]
MPHERRQVIIVGSGCAGLAAANELLEHQVEVLVIDENPYWGGQLLRRVPERLGTGQAVNSLGAKRTGFQLMARLRKRNLKIMNRISVLGISPDRELYVQNGNDRLYSLKSDFIILATGARERFQPFPGWTLPGVFSTGAVQVLLKTSGVLPGHQVLIGGAGFLPYAVAGEVLINRGRLLAVLDQTSLPGKMKLLGQWYHQWPRLLEGASYLARLLMAGVPVKQKTRIIEAKGRRELEAVVAARVDDRGRIVPGSEKTYRPDALAIGYGLIPNVELPQQAGCSIEYQAGRGGWVVKVDDRLETSVKNIYAAGETNGVAGGVKSLVEGRMAALSILRELGRVQEKEYQRRMALYRRHRNRELKFGEFLNSLGQVSRNTYETLPDETVVCRCEEVTMGEIRKWMSQGFSTPVALKNATRMGMGNCQGRICGPVLYDLLAAGAPDLSERMKPLSARLPVKMMRLEALAEADLEGKPE